ncbi:RNA polymerase ECF-type sigma factor SigM [Gordonia araii NBRC 100433]|uniref:RNA polymerase ECF-type sigma factor SigM n=1 Tax=Gordonia araii NBRC 100433 TaxID=1073574 RepID=G7H790_9ACTN|nr:RNA polymerase sigma factor SigM [Gordonia araii]NNG99036.1 RNA polymerase sigma factor SigM [Gordonia araii NBRC 100433]GAB11715.1 RNA polymerase ECF-type sigma factor SigM [Gordonia araii NBRC 100433]
MNRGELEHFSDAQLLEAHVNGHRRAFTLLVRRHHDRMAAVAYRTMNDPQEVPDALQDAWTKAHEMAAQFRADSQVSSWLHRIVVNACLDRMRRSRVRGAKLVPEFDAQLADPCDRTRDVDLAISINRAMRLLPEDQRRAILLVDVEGYSVAETAELLGVATGTIKSRCARGRLRLSVMLRSLRAAV